MCQLSGTQRSRLVRWFWRSCFSRRFSSGVLRNLKDDIAGMQALKTGRPNTLGDFSVLITSEFFKSTSFRLNSVNTKTFVLMLAQKDPLSFVSGQPVSLAEVLREYNRSEFHHLYPRAFLTDQQVPANDQSPLANFCFLSQADNVQLGGVAPSVYRARMPNDIADILDRALCRIFCSMITIVNSLRRGECFWSASQINLFSSFVRKLPSRNRCCATCKVFEFYHHPGLDKERHKVLLDCAYA